MIKCWYYCVDELKNPERFERGMHLLPWEERREKVLRYRFDKDRRLCRGAGILALYALKECGAWDLSLRCAAEGKPFLAGEPHIFFNLSHSGCDAVCAVSEEEVGVDVEEIGRGGADVARISFVREEIDWRKRQEDRDRAFFRLWTRKESYVKCLGRGFSMDLKSFSVSPEDDGTCAHHFHEMEVDAHMLCVCARGQQDAVFRQFSGIEVLQTDRGSADQSGGLDEQGK